MRKNFIDETGHIYGLLTVIEPAKDKNGRSGWLCQCACGNSKIVRGSDLRTGKITSCGRGCPCKINGRFIDETGNTYGRLTVLYRAQDASDDRVKWHCRCICGAEVDVRGTDLRNGKTVSCGCYNRERTSETQFKDEIGHRYTKLVVESLVTKSPKAIWRCKCDCGNYTNVKGIALRSGQIKSCGCLKSQYEENIQTLLRENNINFKREYTFDDLKSPKGTLLRYDFAIFCQDKLLCLIEYNGDQHYISVDYWGGEEGLQQRRQRDELKIQYAREHQIPLLILNKNNDLESDIILFLERLNIIMTNNNTMEDEG